MITDRKLCLTKCGNHIFTLRENTLSRIRNAKKILVQVPEGFKPCTTQVVEAILAKTNDSEVNIDASPNFGSCLLDLEIVREYDLVIHFGHDRYPLWEPPGNVVFEDIVYEPKLNKEVLEELTRDLKERKLRRVLLYVTQQHKNLYGTIRKFLLMHGITVVNDKRKSLAFGCIYPDIAVLSSSVDAVIMVSGGSFHSLGAGISLGGLKPVFKVDPYRYTYVDMTEAVRRVLKVRFGKIFLANKASNWLIIAGIAGQYRPGIVSAVKQAIMAKGGKCFIARCTYLTNATLANLDNPHIDSIIVTSCPRLPIDDLSEYHKPVLTPGEALYVLGKLHSYRFPW